MSEMTMPLYMIWRAIIVNTIDTIVVLVTITTVNITDTIEVSDGGAT